MRGVNIFLFTAAVIFVNILLFLQCIDAFSTWSNQTRRFKVEEIYGAPLEKLTLFRLPGHKSDYIFGLHAAEPDYRRVYFFFPFHKTAVGPGVLLDMEIPRYLGFTNFRVIDNFNNGEPVLPLFGVENRKVILELRNIKGETLKKQILEDLSIPLPTDKMTAGIADIKDIDADGRKDLIWLISGEFAGLPRGIVVHDPLTGKKKWEFLFGPIPRGTIVMDINDDGKKEIVFSAWAPHNNISYNNMDDDTSYVGALDCQGKLLWIYKAGGYYSKEHLAVEDLDLNGTFEVITARSCHREMRPDPGQIRVYDALTGEIIETANYRGISFTNLYVTNMDSDPELEIISSDTNGGLHIWDHKLKTYGEFKGDTAVKILGVYKVHENSFPFIFTWYSYKTLRIFDNQLRTIFNYRFKKEMTNPEIEPIVPVSDGKNTSYVIVTDNTYMISPKPGIVFQDYFPLFRSHFSLYLLGIFVFNGFLYVIWRQRKRIKERYLELMGKSSKTNPQWTVTAQEALHKMKSPITAILWETEKIDSLLEKKRPSKTFWSKLREINTDILADVNELKLMNHFLMKYLQVQTLHLREIDIKEIITPLVDKYQSSFSNKFTFEGKFSSPLPTILADEEQMKEVFSNIIDNAIDAMAEGGTISISAVYYKILPDKKKKNIICVEIEDNGCGISKDKLDTIFEPYYTTKKEGTGIGLAIARRIVESHDGWIKVESQEKIGTKFALYFPVKNLTH
ncbi:MAG: ATP-binding protein [Candidatus Aminicenantes bacterium]|jgi:signal transduction histidine kinase